MQTFIEQSIKNTLDGKEAERILRSCVHCGFCIATCPTYQLLGDELDGPRGRIYLIKSMLEGEVSTKQTMQHLDRCLTCRACETTCPSGVEYGKLLGIGRQHINQKISRPWQHRLYRFLILQSFPYRKRFDLILKFGQIFRFCLSEKLKSVLPIRVKQTKFINMKMHSRKVILFAGCVQPVLAPEINDSVTKVLDVLGVSVIEIKNEQCCGALSHHLTAAEQALSFMRKNIDLYWPVIEQGVEAIIVSASGCGVHIKDYGYLLREDQEYALKAAKISTMTKDISEFMSEFELEDLKIDNSINVAFQSPCTLQHGQKLSGITESLLQRLGFTLAPILDADLCCGSAGVYSLLEKNISNKLQDKKIESLMQGEPELILTANIGCLKHLQRNSPVPVKHWIEEVAASIR
ncbi:MAG: glycolate oxidase iron-sulfur subunit [Legionellales bacterium]|nr:glycolate oxidase iron-sulfur subunit [Legionellales bacterium]